MQTFKIILRCLSDCTIMQKPAHRLASSSSSLPNFIMVDPDEQENMEHDDNDDDHHTPHPSYPILENRCSDLFYMPQGVGPAYQDLFTTADQFDMSKYQNSVGWRGVKPIQAQVVRCPKLLLPYMKRHFSIPSSKLRDSSNFSIFNLYFDCNVNCAIKSFVLIASQYSVEFMAEGYWSDFVNPFTGRAYFHPAAERNDSNPGAGFLGHNMLFRNVNGCTIIKEDKKCTFSGAIFSDVPVDHFD